MEEHEWNKCSFKCTELIESWTLALNESKWFGVDILLQDPNLCNHACHCCLHSLVLARTSTVPLEKPQWIWLPCEFSSSFWNYFSIQDSVNTTHWARTAGTTFKFLPGSAYVILCPGVSVGAWQHSPCSRAHLEEKLFIYTALWLLNSYKTSQFV